MKNKIMYRTLREVECLSLCPRGVVRRVDEQRLLCLHDPKLNAGSPATAREGLGTPSRKPKYRRHCSSLVRNPKLLEVGVHFFASSTITSSDTSLLGSPHLARNAVGATDCLMTSLISCGICDREYCLR